MTASNAVIEGGEGGVEAFWREMSEGLEIDSCLRRRRRRWQRREGEEVMRLRQEMFDAFVEVAPPS